MNDYDSDSFLSLDSKAILSEGMEKKEKRKIDSNLFESCGESTLGTLGDHGHPEGDGTVSTLPWMAFDYTKLAKNIYYFNRMPGIFLSLFLK